MGENGLVDKVIPDGAGFKAVTQGQAAAAAETLAREPDPKKWPDLSQWGPKSVAALHQYYSEVSHQDLATARRVVDFANDRRYADGGVQGHPELQISNPDYKKIAIENLHQGMSYEDRRAVSNVLFAKSVERNDQVKDVIAARLNTIGQQQGTQVVLEARTYRPDPYNAVSARLPAAPSPEEQSISREQHREEKRERIAEERLQHQEEASARRQKDAAPAVDPHEKIAEQPVAGQTFKSVTYGDLQAAAEKMAREPGKLVPGMREWGPNATTMLNKETQEIAKKDFKDAQDALKSIMAGNNKDRALDDVKNPHMREIVAKASPDMSGAEKRQILSELQDQKTAAVTGITNFERDRRNEISGEKNTLQNPPAPIAASFNGSSGGNKPIVENDMGAKLGLYKPVTPNDVAVAADKFASKPESQWPDINKWGPNALYELRMKYNEVSANQLQKATRSADKPDMTYDQVAQARIPLQEKQNGQDTKVFDIIARQLNKEQVADAKAVEQLKKPASSQALSQ